MTDPDLNLLIALDVLLAEVSVAGAARRLGLSASAMSRTLSRLRAVTGDPLLVRAGRNMVLTPYADGLRERTHHAVSDARSLLRPSTNTLQLATLERTFTLRTNDGFVETFGAALIAAAAAVAPGVCLRFAPKPEKAPNRSGKGRSISRSVYWVRWGRKCGCRRCSAIVLLAWSEKGIHWRQKPLSAKRVMSLSVM